MVAVGIAGAALILALSTATNFTLWLQSLLMAFARGL